MGADMGSSYLTAEERFPERIENVIIDKLDMNFVQNLITSVNESKLDQKTKAELRTTLDRWQNALTLTDEINVMF